jgi:hypothetical protein
MLTPSALCRDVRRGFWVALLLAVQCMWSSCAQEQEAEEPFEAFLGDPDCDAILPGYSYTQGVGGLPIGCALPWPSNLYLKEDATRKTGFALQFGTRSLPENRNGIAIDPTAYVKRDGYSVGTPIMLTIPDLDMASFPTESTIESSLSADAKILLFEVEQGAARRIPYWVEKDVLDPDEDRATIFVRPAVLLKEATRYVVAMRNLADKKGRVIPASPAFLRLRQGTTANIPALRTRQALFDKTFAFLSEQGVSRESVVLGWEFVTASSESMHGDLLHMRDDALARMGAKGPELSIEKTIEYAKTNDGTGRPVNEYIGLEIQGTFEVPNYLESVNISGFSGSQLHRDDKGKPSVVGTRKPRFWVRIPHSALSGPPHGLVMYGHGLLNAGDEVNAGNNGKIAQDHGLIFFATNLLGMSEEDGLPVVSILSELSRFRSLTDRLHQGLVEWVLLARGMRERLGELPIVVNKKVQVNKGELFYSGISQGGIFGATFMALTPDMTYGHLGVPGNNYNTLLQRSTDFQQFEPVMSSAYHAPVQINLALAAIQLLWDSADPVSHLRHVTHEPFAGNKPHYVLLAPARGDYQVAVVTNEIAARSDIGVKVMARYDRERRVPLVAEQEYPYHGSGVLLYQFGNPWPQPGNHFPKDSFGDPHGKPRKLDSHSQQMITFFRTGEIIDVCGGDGCTPTLRR